MRLAAEAFEVYRAIPGRERGALLRKIAERIESIAGDIVERARQETALPPTRLQGEVARTCGQLRLFAQVAEEGSWVNARIDRADAEREPVPKPDIRSMLRPLGPVVVFGASNFPLAFSVAGGDTASALAGGNTVIVKAHAAHPGTSELVGRAIQETVRQCGLPEGLFSLLFGSGSPDRSSFDETSFGKGRRLHRLAYCGKNPHGCGGVPPGTHSVLCGNEQHKSRIYFAGGAAATRRENCGWVAYIVHHGGGTILHQARAWFFCRKAPTLSHSRVNCVSW